MERLNKVTLKKELHTAMSQVRLTVRKNGAFGVTMALYELIGKPEYVEFVTLSDKLYLMRSEKGKGFKVTLSHLSKNISFACMPVVKRFFNVGQKYPVFTDPIVVEIDGVQTNVYQVKI